MILDLYFSKRYASDYQNVYKAMLLNTSPSVVDGKILNTSEYVEYDYVEYASQFNSSDFALSNLMAIGATDLLIPITLDVNNNMTIADSFAESMATSTPKTS